MSTALLAVNTAAQSCGVAIMVDGRVRAAIRLNHGQTHSRFLMQAVDSALMLSGIVLSDIDVFAVTQGPGSFTGLRIGISTVKGLAFGTDKPIVGVSSLEALAWQAPGSASRVCVMLDARRREIYWCLYAHRHDLLSPITSERVGSVEDLLEQIEGPCVAIGNAALLYADQLEEKTGDTIQLAPAVCHEIQPDTLAQLAWQRFQQGKAEDPDSFVPVYLRKSDAQINREKRKIDSFTPVKR
jgi:tRNA threonylcarbamoyladenosine biosynthesis protein TsaB